ncbi:MAG: glucose-phosphate thymidylyltransferase [Gemmatimonadetes bacterium]|nr:glucose-phosphate thymidylyltransferase [Gemmatimonadota bacterium]
MGQGDALLERHPLSAHDGTTTRAVILARGLGTRMRKADDGAELDAAQSAAADTGVKGMIPIGRPFLDYLVSALADAGYSDVCLVIGPEHDIVREHFAAAAPSRVRVHFAVQPSPRGTADAVLAAESFAGEEPFVVINSDNYYGIAPLRALHERRTPATIAFDRDALVRLGNVPPERVERFGALEIDDTGALRRIHARPTDAMRAAGPLYASLNCWLFDAAIFDACRTVPLSARGESELPQAVQRAIDGGMRVEAVRLAEPVLDMSSRADIASVAERLRDVRVVL